MFIIGRPTSYFYTFVTGLIAGFALGTHATHAEPPQMIPPYVEQMAPIRHTTDDDATFSYANGVVLLHGMIAAETPYMLDYKINVNHWDVMELALDSQGGSTEAGYQLGAMVIKRGWHTMVHHQCDSACVLVWASAPAAMRHLSPAGWNMRVHQAKDSLAYTTVGNMPASRAMAAYLAIHGAPGSVVKGLLKTTPDDLYTVFTAEVEAWK